MMKKLEINQIESAIRRAAESVELAENPDPLEAVVAALGDTDEAKAAAKLLGLVAGELHLPSSVLSSSGIKTERAEDVPELPGAGRLRLSVRWLRVLQAAAERQRRNIAEFLEASGIDPSLLESPGFDAVYEEAEAKARRELPDESLYRARYRRCRKEGCPLCATGPGHGPYWYRVYREGNKVRTLYVGKALPPQALGYASPHDRFVSLLAVNLKRLLCSRV